MYVHGRHLGHVTITIWRNFVRPTHGGSRQNLASIRQVASEEKMFENVDDGWTDGWQHAYLHYKLKNEPLAQLS